MRTVPSGLPRLTLTSNFSYSRLKAPDSIRLLRLHSPINNRINCSLEEFSLADAPPFDAISYTWGYPLLSYPSAVTRRRYRQLQKRQDVRSKFDGAAAAQANMGSLSAARDSDDLDTRRAFPIICNNSTLHVTANLRNALQALTKVDFAKEGYLANQYIWIDAICVNQDDLNERNAQVSLMADIFQAATKTVIYLGGDDEFTKDALAVIRSIGSLAEDFDKSLVRYNGFFDDGGLYDKLGVPPLSHCNWLGFLAFINRPWFKRAWVIQELALSRLPVIILGSSIIPWELLSRTLTFVRDSKWYHHLSTRKLRHIQSLKHESGKYRRLLASDTSFSMAPIYLVRTRSMITRFREGRTKGSHRTGQSLRVLVETHRFTKSTDPRDKVYAFLGLSDQDKPPLKDPTTLIRPDYSISVQEVYLKLTRAMLLSSKNLGVLCHVQDKSTTSISGLPSWVPDYSVSQRPYSLIFRGSPPWRASRGTFWEWDKDMESLEKGLLHVKGHRVDLIEDIAKLSSESDDPASTWSSLIHVTAGLDDRYPIAYSNGYQPSRMEVFWRTLITNTYNRRHPAPERCGELFMDYILNLQIRHQLVPWSSTEEFHPHQNPLAGSVYPEWHSLLEAEPHDSQYGLQLYERRFFAVVWSLFRGTYSPIELTQLQHEIDNASGTVRRVYRTKKGLLGTGPRSLRIDDEVWILHGSPVPLILRKLSNGNYSLVGETYIHGLMHGKGCHMQLPLDQIILE